MAYGEANRSVPVYGTRIETNSIDLISRPVLPVVGQLSVDLDDPRVASRDDQPTV